MGCTNTKVEGIPAALLDDLPVEIIYKILDELDISTIFQSLYHVCKHFDKILSSYDEYHVNLKIISLKNFRMISSFLRPEQITRLTLSDDETTPGLVELFLSKFAMNTFVRLRSLSLAQIDNEELINQILIPIADHSSLTNFSSIKIINDDETYSDIFVELLMSIVTKPSLREAYLDLSYSRTTSSPLPWQEQSPVRQMTFIGTCTMKFIRDTFTHAPQLEALIADDFDFYDENDLNESPNHQANDDDDDDEEEVEDDSDDPDEVEIEAEVVHVNNVENPLSKKEKFTSIESCHHLTSLTLTSFTFNMSKLEWVLQEIPTLKRFSLTTTVGYDDETILDGQRWETLVPNIEIFKFSFSVSISDSSAWNTDTCITSFRKPFWIEQKQWFVSLEKYDDIVLLYTLPYLETNYVMKTESSSFEYRSTAIQNSTLHTQSMKNVCDLYIDTSEQIQPQMKNFPRPRFCHITHLILHGKWSKSKSFLSDIQTIVDLKTVKELTRDECIPTTDFIVLLNLLTNLQSIRTNTNFLDALNAAKFCHMKCLRAFIVDPNYDGDQRTVNIEPFCAMFPRIQHLSIPVDSVESCQYALDQLHEDLISVIFQIPENDNTTEVDDSEDDAGDDSDDTEEEEKESSTIGLFSEWIKELPKQYHCHKKLRHIHISLK